MEHDLNIIETLFIPPFPSPPLAGDGSAAVLPLSRLDSDRNLAVKFRTLRIYPPSSTSISDLVRVISDALSKALFHFYPLAGTLHRLPGSGRLAVRCSACDSVPLTIATSPSPLGSLHTEPGSEFLNRLAPDSVEQAQPLALQVTRFACGGIALGMCVQHAMCDGAGATKFLSAVAGFARGEDRVRIEPVWDRLALIGPRSPPHVEAGFGEILGFDNNGPCEKIDDLLKECFHVSEVCLNRFRKRLNDEAGLSFTAFQALGAFIWRARIKASAITSEQIIKFAYSMNVANLLKPALPDGYWGNVCVPVYVKLAVGELLEQPISETAKLIKESKRNVTDEYVRSYIDFQELHHGKGITAGERVSGFTDWRHLGHSEVDFGWGSPRVVLPLSWRILGSTEPTFFLPYAEEDAMKDGFKVLVCLPEEAMAAFRVEMGKFNPCS